MRRRVVADDTGVRPAELVDYRRWCADRGLAPFGDPDDPVSMRDAALRWDAWMGQRRAWAFRNGVDEGELPMPDCAPWNEGLI